METESMAVREQRWMQAIYAAANSGLTKSAWCEQNKVSKASFYRWSKLLREKTLQAKKSQPEFVRISMQEQAYGNAISKTPIQTIKACESFVLHMGEIALEIPSNANSEAITRILRGVQNAW